jgi:hypothetical protein
MPRTDYSPYHKTLARFDRQFFSGKDKFTYIGSGELGGKAHGLAKMNGIIQSSQINKYTPDLTANIPTLTVITTEYFDLFMKQNNLHEIAYADTRDDLIAHAFQKASLPVQLVGDLRALVQQIHTPLAIRSSSMLEDAMFEPFASVYATKMIPNNQPDADTRFRKLTEAIKFVYASTFFKAAGNYMKSTHHATIDEKMAVVIQEVVGTRFGDRFYPHMSGVARSYNFYPTGHAKPDEGVVDLAIGLGKAIVDDGKAWSYSPAYPRSNPPYNSINDLLKQTQTEFWAVNMGKPPVYNPIEESEYLARFNLADSEYDGTLRYLASTYSPQNDRITIGTGIKGPRILDFAPILRTNQLPLNEFLKTLLQACEDTLGSLVEIEFAMTLDHQQCVPATFGFLQVRPMVVSQAKVEVSDSDLTDDRVLVASESVLGNGVVDNIRDVVYIKPETFDVKYTPDIALELENINRSLVEKKKPYLLIGFGRWGTSDPQGGIPVNFGQISGAKVIVESTLSDLNFNLSQGSHFFHNVTSFQICYFSLYHWGQYKINWDWLNQRSTVAETRFVKHVEFSSPLKVKVDGRCGRGVIFYE